MELFLELHLIFQKNCFIWKTTKHPSWQKFGKLYWMVHFKEKKIHIETVAWNIISWKLICYKLITNDQSLVDDNAIVKIQNIYW